MARETSQWRQMTALAATPAAEIRQRRAAAEQTLAAVRGRLGAAGTYEMPGEPGYVAPGAAPTAPTGPAAPSAGAKALLTRAAKGGGRGKAWAEAATAVGERTQEGIFDVAKIEDPAALSQIDPKYGGRMAVEALGSVKQLSPERAAAAVEQSAEFRIMSRLTAQSEQLIARQGPLWDSLIRNQQLPIIEGSAAMAKESAENIRRAAAKGGAARRDAFEAVQRMNTQREINTQRMQTVAQMRVDLDKWAIDNAQKQITFNQGWAENLAGIRESYNAAMDNASALFATASQPVMFASQEKSQEWRAYSHAKQRSKLGGWIQGAIGVGMMAGGAYMGSPELIGAGAKTTLGGFSGPKSPAGY